MKCDCCMGEVGRVVWYSEKRRKRFCRKQCYLYYRDQFPKRAVAPVRYVRATPYHLGMAGNVVPSLLFLLTSRHVARSGRQRLTTPVR